MSKQWPIGDKHDKENRNITPLVNLKSPSTSQIPHRFPGDVRFGFRVVELIDIRSVIITISFCISSLRTVPRIVMGLSTMTDLAGEVRAPVLKMSFRRAPETIRVMHVVRVARSLIKERSFPSRGDSSCGCQSS